MCRCLRLLNHSVRRRVRRKVDNLSEKRGEIFEGRFAFYDVLGSILVT